MAQHMVSEHTSHHRFGNWDGSDTDAGVVAALGRDLGLFAKGVDGFPRGQNRTGRLHGETDDQVLSGGNAAEDAAIVVI
jgi:hypothetical protein